ncbi:MAG: 2'-deoxycytidine 5'-triphosphate deaminase [Paracoccaceae bacterium]
MTEPIGVLPSQDLRALHASGGIRAAAPLDADQIQPASLDLRLGARALRLRASFLPGPDRSVAQRAATLSMAEIDLTHGALLERGCVYLVELAESLALPPTLHGATNAKSSTGRLDLLTRVLCDRGTEFDRIPAGYHGPLWAEICPRSFAVLARPGQRLSQLRLRAGDARLDDAALSALHADSPLVDGPALIDGGLGFSVDLSGSGIVGWRARPHAAAVDLAAIGTHEPAAYWEGVTANDGQIVLDPGAFYILVSREAVAIPPSVAAEMAPYLAVAGEFRVHYAGFFDPGFGLGAPARGVLEVRAHESPFVLEHGQTVGRLVFERMRRVPDMLYGAGIASNYHGQGLKLSKHFAAP